MHTHCPSRLWPTMDPFLPCCSDYYYCINKTGAESWYCCIGDTIKMLRHVWPGKKRLFCRGKVHHLFYKSCHLLTIRNSNGQNDADTHCGTTRVSSGLVTSACLSKHGTRCMGRHHQLFLHPNDMWTCPQLLSQIPVKGVEPHCLAVSHINKSVNCMEVHLLSAYLNTLVFNI